ncbi:DUF6443 domain-containing protein [Aquimarina latercula]|uniref:DUF6443 domain-containing protein n=1 Tax=Aquimarina latercula TaxID=987 RepID=UPI00138B183F|nr:DUF6443 domain-containing protein [Aquimarina latercula]
MRNLFLVIAVLVCTVLRAQTQTENYVKTTIYQTEVQEGQQSEVLESDKIISVNYFDGLGRVKQSVAVRASGQQQNTNVLDWTDEWKVGTGSTPLFNMNGPESDNQRLIGTNPFGEQSLLWKCGNDSWSDRDGGWYTDNIPIDNTVTYRYTVWVKRTGSQDGTTYHGPGYVNNMNGTANNNPYFWSGDLPQLDTWYLIVGIVHPHNYVGDNTGMSGVYDINGNRVRNGVDFKWRSNYNYTSFRSFFFYSTDVNTHQYFWNPIAVQTDYDLEPIAKLIEVSKPKDIVTHYEYDNHGRQTKEYLPYASEQTQNGAIYTDPLIELNAFYDTPKYQNTPNPYSETIFEDSPLNKPLKQAAPGLSWIAESSGNDHTIKFNRRPNNNDDAVIFFKVNFTNEDTEKPSLVKVRNYSANELYVNITKDENWKSTDDKNNTTEEYTDKLGRVVLKRAFNNNDPHDTYYVYDDFGNLTYVIPPKVDTSNGIDTNELNELCYQYIYDYLNRLVEKKIPGKGWEYIVYNKSDQPVLTQDANQRLKPVKEWFFTKYDAFGRETYTGIIKNDSDRLALQGSANNPFYSEYEDKQTGANPVAGTNIYYTNNAIPRFMDRILTVNYFDDYTFDHNAPNPGSVYGQNISTSIRGLDTGSKVRVLDTNDWITTVTYYDEKRRPVYVHSTNTYLKTVDITETKLDFTGKPLVTKITHVKDNNLPIVTVNTFSYDHMGRLLTQKQQINNLAEELITQNLYDDLGQLESKKVGNAEQAPLQIVDYKYNVRGWLTDINDVNAIGNDLFTFKINYDTVEGSYSAPSLYNGNISQTIWRTANDHVKRSYTYNYDALNRITRGHRSRGNNLMTEDSYSVWGIAYDKNGNIGRIARNGRPTGSSSQLIDELYYTYENNKLLKVRDATTSVYKIQGFKDGVNTNDDYVYDDNGNLIIDRNKEIFNISYNHLNLPEKITFNKNGTKYIQYWYDASGNKLKKFVLSNPRDGGITTEYDGGYIYENFQLKFSNHAEGYTEPLFYTDKNDNLILYDFDYVYQLKDHLGNIRVLYSDKDKDGKIDVLRNNVDVDGDEDYSHEIMQEKNYYPFGMSHKGYNDLIVSEHKYGFGGKEEQNELGLNWLDFGARNYDSSIGRWMNIDNMSEDYLEWSPYNYVLNNPNYFIDPDGNDVWLYDIDSNQLTWVSDVGGSEVQFVGITNSNNDNLGMASVTGNEFHVTELENSVFVSSYDATSDIPEGYNSKSGYHYTGLDLKKRHQLKELGGVFWGQIRENEASGNAEPIHSKTAVDAYERQWGTNSAFWFGAQHYFSPDGGTRGVAQRGYNALRKHGSSLGDALDGSKSSARSVLRNSSKSALRSAPAFKSISASTTSKSGSISKSVSKPVSNATSKAQAKVIKNSWNSFLNLTKGTYTGKNWLQKASKDYKRLQSNTSN